MNLTLATLSSSSSPFHFNPSLLRVTTANSQSSASVLRFRVKACSSSSSRNEKNFVLEKVKTCAGAAVFIGTAAVMIGKFSVLPARAESPVTVTEQIPLIEEEEEKPQSSPLTELLESNSDAIEAMKSLLQQRLEKGEDEEAVKILKGLVSAQPSVTEWKFLMARLLNEMGQTENARNVFEEILALNPLSFEALFENALLMDRCGEGEGVIKRLEEALNIAEEENKVKEARDVRLIIAQIQFLQKNLEEALKSYQQLAKEDPNDFRPYFCQGMIYSLIDQNAEAREQFAKYRAISPKKFEVEGFLRTPLSRMKLFGTDEEK